MFIALFGCFFFGAMACLGAPDDTPEGRQQELYKEMGKIIMQNLGVKNPPKMTKEERRKHLPQSLIDLYNKEAKGLESKLEKRYNDTIRDFENEGELTVRKASRDCHREPMYVDFDKIYGRNHYIIAPGGFNAYYCHGVCSGLLTRDMKPTNHALLHNLVSLSSHSTVPGPCCVPRKLAKISVLYYDDKRNFQLKHMDNMVAKECGCH